MEAADPAQFSHPIDPNVTLRDRTLTVRGSLYRSTRWRDIASRFLSTRLT